MFFLKRVDLSIDRTLCGEALPGYPPEIVLVVNGEFMKTSFWMLAYVVLATLLSGCQQQSSNPESSAANQPNRDLVAPVVDLNSKPKQQPEANATPQEIVTQFLRALCQGDADAVTQLLTEKARVETKKHQLAVQPPGTAAAQYQVGKVELVEGGAYVNSVWSEPATDGNRQRYEIVWVLRSQADGWRVAGMAARIDANRELTYLNFEDPQEMLSKWESVDTELANRPADSNAPRVSERPTQAVPR